MLGAGEAITAVVCPGGGNIEVKPWMFDSCPAHDTNMRTPNTVALMPGGTLTQRKGR
jgi:hypothetical protein